MSSHDDEPLARPFLEGTPAAPDGRSVLPEQDVRPYVITSGRTPTGPAIPLEALARTTADGEAAPVSYEVAHILHLCRRPQSVAELSAYLRLPLGVVRVLLTDLAADDLITLSPRPTSANPVDDPEFLERLMLGVAAL